MLPPPAQWVVPAALQSTLECDRARSGRWRFATLTPTVASALGLNSTDLAIT